MLKIFIIWLANIAIKIILIIAFTLCITDVKGVWKERTSPDNHHTFYELTETPRFAVKTNLLYDLTTSLNLGIEFGLGRKTTLDLSFNWNPWTYNREENTKFKFFLFQPELRYWTCEAFRGHFFGVHGHYAYYNVGRLPTPLFSETMNMHRFEGQLAGAGISYGYHWIINPRWSLEAEIGAGYARLWYDKYPCQRCAKLLVNEKKNYWGLTRAGINLIYVF